jgi:hypothetical protein
MRTSIKDYKSCSKNSLIRLSHNFATYSRRHFKSCDSRHSDLAGYIYFHQDELGVRKGEIRVEREIETSQEYKKYGGKNGYREHLRNIIKSTGR